MNAPVATSDQVLTDRVRRGETAAWEELIARYEGRLTAFVRRRLSRQDEAEDIVQDVFLGFLQSLPHYDGERSLESYLISIAVYKLADHLRRQGRRPQLPGGLGDESFGVDAPAPGRSARSLLASRERNDREEIALAEALRELLDRWRERGDWDKIRCLELLTVRGWSNKQTAETLALPETRIATIKHEAITRLQQAVQRQLKIGRPE